MDLCFRKLILAAGWKELERCRLGRDFYSTDERWVRVIVLGLDREREMRIPLILEHGLEYRSTSTWIFYIDIFTLP